MGVVALLNYITLFWKVLNLLHKLAKQRFHLKVIVYQFQTPKNHGLRNGRNFENFSRDPMTLCTAAKTNDYKSYCEYVKSGSRGAGWISALVSTRSTFTKSVRVVSSSMYLMEDAESLLGELEYEPSTSDLQMKDEGTQRAKTSKKHSKTSTLLILNSFPLESYFTIFSNLF